MATVEEKKELRKGRLVFRLAWKDLRHEWILSLCLVMAVTAVLGPIFILFGLKFGSMELLRSRLVEDPRNREVRPMASTHYDQQWFTDIAARPDVAFVIPMTRQISSAVHSCVLAAGGQQCRDKGAAIDLLPTAENDPLLLENGGITPQQNQCVLTAAAAEKLGATEGAELRMTVKRIIGGSYEKVQRRMRVTSVLDERAGAVAAMFVPLSMLEAVEQYKDGGGVPAYGWPGKSRSAYPLFDGVIIWVPSSLSPVEQLRLKSKTGFSDIKSLGGSELTEQTQLHIGAAGSSYLLTTRNKAVNRINIETVAHRLRGKSARIIPWVKPITAEIITADNSSRQISLISLGYDKKLAAKLAVSPAVFWQGLTGKPQKQWLIATTGKSLPAESQTINLRVRQGENTLTLPLNLDGRLLRETERLYIPAELGGLLRLLKERQIEFIPKLEGFTLCRQGYAGFRLYTATIDQVDRLRRDFEDMGVAVTTQAERIRDVKELNYYLTLIFWIIAAAATIGGAATLAASLYSSVERKRREIAVLRLLGFSRTGLLAFPLYQGILLCLGGFLAAVSFFYLLAGLINHLFADMIRANESLCMLLPVHLFWFLAAIILIAVLAATGAAWRVTRLELVEALRDE